MDICKEENKKEFLASFAGDIAITENGYPLNGRDPSTKKKHGFAE